MKEGRAAVQPGSHAGPHHLLPSTPGHPRFPSRQAQQAKLGFRVWGRGGHVALARPSVDVRPEPYTPAGTSGALVTQVWKASCQALGASTGAGSCLGQDLPRSHHVTALLSYASALPTKTSPLSPSLRIRAWLEGSEPWGLPLTTEETGPRGRNRHDGVQCKRTGFRGRWTFIHLFTHSTNPRQEAAVRQALPYLLNEQV